MKCEEGASDAIEVAKEVNRREESRGGTYQVADSGLHLGTDLYWPHRTNDKTVGKRGDSVPLVAPERFGIVERFSSCV